MKKIVLLAILLPAVFLMAEVNIVKQSKESIFIQLTFENYKLIDFDGFTGLEVDGWEFNQIPGAPFLPQKWLPVAVPPEGNLEIIILNKKENTINANYPILPAPLIVDGKETSDYIYNIDQNKYFNYRKEHIALGERSSFRHYDYIPIQFYPVLLNPETNALNICENLTIEIRISGDVNYRHNIEDGLDMLYSSFFINFETAKNWRTQNVKYHSRMPFESSEFWYKIETSHPGWYQITYKDLSKLPRFCDPNSLRMFTLQPRNRGIEPEYQIVEIPLLIEDENNFLSSDDKIYFERKQNPNYSDNNSETKIFWLTFGVDLEISRLQDSDFQKISSVQEITGFVQKEMTNDTSYREEVDGIIIYPEAGVFDSAGEDLAALFPELNFVLKSQADIFDEYSGGTADPWAIRFYLEDQFNAHPELFYCVLMGSGTSSWDQTTEKDKIIAFNGLNGNWASDDNFCLFNNFPELAMGRIPAQNDADMNLYMERLITYVNEPTPGFWRNKVLIIPDDENKSGGYEGYAPTSGLNHSNQAQLTAELLKPEIYVDKVMAIEYEFDEFQNKPEARMAMVNSINEGRLIWYYIGHGNEDVLGDEDYFRGSQHMNLLDNLEHLPLFLAASCEVGQFNYKSYDCLAEKLLLYEYGGAIASIAASSKCGGSANNTLMKKFLQNILNEVPPMTIGEGLLDAKLTYLSNYIGNNRQYNILGVPMMTISTPPVSGNISGISSQLQPRQFVQFSGDFNTTTANLFSEYGELRVFEPEKELTYTNLNFIPVGDSIPWTVNYTKEGNKIYFGQNDIDNNGEFTGEFFVPDDVKTGDSGLIYNYYYDNLSGTDMACVLPGISFGTVPLNTTSTSAPSVNLFLESKTFAPGDFVSTDPLIIAEIEDENGINISGAAGHKMLVLLDDSFEPIDVTGGFMYNIGSATAGELYWQLHDLAEGLHHLTLIVFDNFNNPTVAQTDFRSKKSGKVAIKQILPYPNPMKSDGWFTFVITEEADVTISIYTISGRKIKTIKAPGLSSGYNQVYWDGKDGDGDEIANNTYFFKIKAKQLSNNKVSEEIGKLIILK